MTRIHLSNAAYNILEYVAQPAAMLIAAPILMHRLGVPSYGLWLIASAVASTGGLVSSGFGDAIVQRIALLSASRDLEAMDRVVRTMFSINLAMGIFFATVLWMLIPLFALRIMHHDASLSFACIWPLRIGSLLVAIKAVESVFISAQKACQRYGDAVRIALATRLLTTASCVGLAFAGYGVTSLMLATACVSCIGAAAQSNAVRRSLGAATMWPAWDRATSRQLLSFGGFSWLQALAGVIFNQADRLVLGATLGPGMVAYYAISVQIAQPIHGLTAAGLHFVFPHLSTHFATSNKTGLQRIFLTSLSINIAAAGALTALVMLFGERVLAIWMGTSLAVEASSILPLIALGFGLLALNVTAHYTLMALGHVRTVTALNVAGGVLMLLSMAPLIRAHGIKGAALGRLWYGPVTCLLYLPLLALLRDERLKRLQIRQAEVEAA